MSLCDGTGVLHLSLLQYKTRRVVVVGIGCQLCPQCIPSVCPLFHVQEYPLLKLGNNFPLYISVNMALTSTQEYSQTGTTNSSVLMYVMKYIHIE